MRDFFIIALEYIIHVVVVLAILLLFIATAMVGLGMYDPGIILPGGVGSTGPLAAVFLFIVGFIQIILVAGMLYLGFGIYQNTRRMAEALENRLMN